jgi:DNA-binding HxlR family transcriptional regulator
MRRTSFDTMRCSIARTLDVVGDPWTLLVVREAFFGTTRFDDFRRNLGIPRATLSARLATLVDHEVLERHTEPETPSRPTYGLTPKGRALSPVMTALMQWGDHWSGVGEPPVTLLDLDTGDEIEPVYVDRRTGRPLSEVRIGRRLNG